MEPLPALLVLCKGNPTVTLGSHSLNISDMELCCFLCCWPGQVVEQTIELSVIWDALMHFIMSGFDSGLLSDWHQATVWTDDNFSSNKPIETHSNVILLKKSDVFFYAKAFRCCLQNRNIFSRNQYINGLVQDCSNALELLQSCTKPSI